MIIKLKTLETFFHFISCNRLKTTQAVSIFHKFSWSHEAYMFYANQITLILTFVKINHGPKGFSYQKMIAQTVI